MDIESKPNVPQFDVFLSHSSVDKAWVMKLKDDLLRYGISVWLDKDEIRPGDLFAEALEQALDNCKAIALIVSPEAVDSGWVKEEYYRALSLATTKQTDMQLIPVVLRDAELPGFLRSRNWVDFRDETAYDQNAWKLVWGITGQKPVRILTLGSLGPNSSASVQRLSWTEAATHVTFICSGPVPPSHFIGREREVGYILDQLTNPARVSSAISGDPCVGKTSLLHYLCEPEVSEAWGLSPDWCHFLYLDCQNVDPFSEAAFWQFTLRELERHLSTDEALSGHFQTPLAQASPNILDLNSLFDKVARAGRLVVFMLDEFEWVIENLDQNALGLLNRLRALLNRRERGLALLIATRTPLKELCARFRFVGSPFDNAFSAITLPPFREAEVDELLIRYQANFSSTERTYLRELAGTHPYLVQLGASLIVRARGGQVEAEIPLPQIEVEFERKTEGYFSALLDYSSEWEKMLLALLALSQLSQQLPADKAGLGDLARIFGRYDREIDHLVERGFVLDQPDGPVLFSPIFARWILRKVIISRGQGILSGWKPHYASYLSPVQKGTLEDLVDKVIRRPDVAKRPELLAQMFAQDEAS
jgi:hypothetical protein